MRDVLIIRERKLIFILFQSAVSQIHQALTTDSERLLTRTQQKRNQYRVLGTPLPAETVQDKPAPGVKKTAAPPEFDEQIFDDTDFYQQLLKDLLDSSIDEKGTKITLRLDILWVC
jgi:protein AATF/BFR2